MAPGYVQYRAVILIALIFGATAEECVCEDGGYEISYGGAALCATGAVGAVAAAPTLLTYAGFSAAGVVAGSIAAAAQSYIGGTVASTSFFAMLQSAGAGGIGYGYGAVFVTAAGTFCGITKKDSCCPGKK